MIDKDCALKVKDNTLIIEIAMNIKIIILLRIYNI
jgi:hypothetical protein